MVERRIELDRRYKRKDKMRKLKKKLETSTGEAREKIVYKIKRLSPFWTEASLKPADAAAAAPKAEKKKSPAKKKA
ncbi:MAG: hypothetical protein KF873_22670 [Gemmataceae bacterium]|nr:hypothetical protein [Planctomycetia bacterium]MBX3401548.1 hypothetical protein [Gemmataceae bacterium]